MKYLPQRILSLFLLLIGSQGFALLSWEDPSDFDFGTLHSLHATEKRLGVVNRGREEITSLSGNLVALNPSYAQGLSPFSLKGGKFPGLGGTCRSRLKPGESCQIVIQFFPKLTTPEAAVLTLTYRSQGEVHNLERKLHGRRLQPAVIEVGVNETFSKRKILHLGSVLSNKKAILTLHIVNRGELAAKELYFSSPMHPAFSNEIQNQCPKTLYPEKDCSLVLEVVAQEPEVITDSLNLSYFDGNQIQKKNQGILLEVLPNSQIERQPITPLAEIELVSPIQDDVTLEGILQRLTHFGKVPIGEKKLLTFTLKNRGNAPANKIESRLLQTPAFQIINRTGADTCGKSLEPDKSCFLDIQFAPEGFGTTLSRLNVYYNNGMFTRVVSQQLEGEGYFTP